MILTTLLFLCSFLPAQSENYLNPASLPREAAQVQAFVPSGWQLESQVEGDLNRDAVADAALVLVEKLPPNADKENPPERNRALVLLFKIVGSQWQRAAVGNKVLLCTRCGGAFFGVAETPVTVSISNGVVIVKQEHGSRNLTSQTLRFRYEPAVQKMVLIGLDLRDVDRATGVVVEESTNFLTGVKLRKQTRFQKGTDKELPVSTQRLTVPKNLKPLAEINHEDFYVN
jgi:hypothetical protein